jgi:CRISPR-associated exonuclease Cas4
VEENHGRPDYGILRYADRSFRIEYTPALRQELVDSLGEMRLLLEHGEAPGVTQERGRCRNCGYREDCGNGV